MFHFLPRSLQKPWIIHLWWGLWGGVCRMWSIVQGFFRLCLRSWHLLQHKLDPHRLATSVPPKTNAFRLLFISLAAFFNRSTPYCGRVFPKLGQFLCVLEKRVENTLSLPLMPCPTILCAMSCTPKHKAVFHHRSSKPFFSRMTNSTDICMIHITHPNLTWYISWSSRQLHWSDVVKRFHRSPPSVKQFCGCCTSLENVLYICFSEDSGITISRIFLSDAVRWGAHVTQSHDFNYFSSLFCVFVSEDCMQFFLNASYVKATSHKMVCHSFLQTVFGVCSINIAGMVQQREIWNTITNKNHHPAPPLPCRVTETTEAHRREQMLHNRRVFLSWHSQFVVEVECDFFCGRHGESFAIYSSVTQPDLGVNFFCLVLLLFWLFVAMFGKVG